MFSNKSFSKEIKDCVFYKLNDSKCKWNWCFLGENPMITWDIVIAYPTKPWNWWALSKNPNITWEIVINNPDKPWNW
jgi:hypothetical protein